MNRRGAALLFAVAAIAALGMISITGFGLARMEGAAGLAAMAEVQARGAAEAALAEAMAGWPKPQTPVLPGQETLLSTVSLPGPATGRAVVRALGGPVFSIHSSGIRRSVGGEVLAAIVMEQLIRLDSAGSDSLIRPRKYPLGWRLLP